MATLKKKKATQSKKGKIVSLVRKSNNLIEARYNFDVWEMRLFLVLISNIRRDDTDFGFYRIHYRDVAKTFGLNMKRGYSEIREAAKSLLDKKFYVDSVVDGFQRQNIYHIIRKINILKEGQDGKAGVENQEYLDVQIEDEMKPLLLQLQKSFTTYSFENIINLGLYSIRIYELLKQYETIGKRVLKFEEMKKMFELEDKYPLFANFYAKVVAPSIKEINLHTDLLVTDVEHIKEGRRTTALRFFFRVQKRLREPEPEPVVEQAVIDFTEQAEILETITHTEPVNDARFSALYPKVVEALGVTPSVFIELIKNYTDEQFTQAIRVTNRAKIEGLIKTNPSGFFVQALKNGYTDQKEERMKKAQKEEEQKRLSGQITALELEKDRRIYERLKALTASDDSLTLKAIEKVKNTEGGLSIIDKEELRLDRSLEVEDFRQIKELRFMVIETLISDNLEKFSDIVLEFDAKINELKMKDIF
jgi:plasmid replication initiation protein